ncbi:hypothetical protein [Candidatus Ruthturnera calyptogenae]|nr:hypothetical protein [Candidatus Ruthturnera calyptogenae]
MQFDERNLLIHFSAAISSKNLEMSKEVFERFITKDKKLNAALI